MLRALNFSLCFLLLSALVGAFSTHASVVEETAFHANHLPDEGVESASLDALPASSESPLLIFVSFSLGEKSLLNLAQEAKRYEAHLVLRGFKDGSYRKTVKALETIITKTGVGFEVDPELFELFQVKMVPTYVLSKPFPPTAMERKQTPLHDRMQGHVSLKYALEIFSQEGDLKDEAKTFLKQIETQRERAP